MVREVLNLRHALREAALLEWHLTELAGEVAKAESEQDPSPDLSLVLRAVKQAGEARKELFDRLGLPRSLDCVFKHGLLAEGFAQEAVQKLSRRGDLRRAKLALEFASDVSSCCDKLLSEVEGRIAERCAKKSAERSAR